MTPEIWFILVTFFCFVAFIIHQIVSHNKRVETYLNDLTADVFNIISLESDLASEWQEEIKKVIMDTSFKVTPYFSLFSGDNKRKQNVVDSHFRILKWLVIRKDPRTDVVARTLEKEISPELGVKSLLSELQRMPWPDHIRVWLNNLDEEVEKKYPTTIQKMARYARERTLASSL